MSQCIIGPHCIYYLEDCDSTSKKCIGKLKEGQPNLMPLWYGIALAVVAALIFILV